MERTTGVAEGCALAGLQIAFGYFSVAPPAAEPVATGPFTLVARTEEPSTGPVLPAGPVTFAVRPSTIQNAIWVVFRGTRDQRTGQLTGEIVPDVQMRVLSSLPAVAFGLFGVVAIVAAGLVPLLRGASPDVSLLVWGTFGAVFAVVWARGCGAAVHEVAASVRHDSPGSDVRWHRGLRCGSRAAAPPPPPPQPLQPPPSRPSGAAVGAAAVPWQTGAVPTGAARPASAVDDRARPSRASVWLGLVGLVVPIAIVLTFFVPAVRSRVARSDWIRIDGVAGVEVDVDHRIVTYVLPDGTEETRTLSVMRTVEAGDRVELYYPPGRPDLIEEDQSGFILPYVVFGGFAVLMTALVLGRFVVGLRRSRRPASAPS